MKLTIDEALTNLEGLQKDYQDFHDEVWKDPETYSINAESLKIAIDTMHKYQEIRKIYMTHHYTDEEVIEKIKEVIKWG